MNYTKNYILEHIGEFAQEHIFAKYLNIEIETIIDCIENGSTISSPFRVDKNPSFSFQRQGTTTDRNYIVRGRDFTINYYSRGTYFWGDCFDAVIHVLEKNPELIDTISTFRPKKEKEWFQVALKSIVISFKIDLFVEQVLDIPKLLINSTGGLGRKRKIFLPEYRSWDNFDKDFWYNKRYVPKSHLELFKVCATSQIFIWQEETQEYINIFQERPNDICYTYYFGTDENGIPLYKFYFPLRSRFGSRHRFMTNFNHIPFLDNKYINLGIALISEIGIISKSHKDKLCLDQFTINGERQMVYPLPAENYIPSEIEAFEINIRHNLVFVFVDFDLTGIRLANKLKRLYNWIPIFITNGRFKTKKRGVKDFEEHLAILGYYNTLDLVKEFEIYYYTILKKIRNFNKQVLK